MPTKDQWANWKDHPCTQAMAKWLRESRELGYEEASYGEDDNSLLRLGVKLGKINAFTVMINYGFTDEDEESND